MRVVNPVSSSPGIEYLALPQMLLIGAISFSFLSIIVVLILEKNN
jgi:hypothetical protein